MPRFLDPDQQKELAALIEDLGRQPAGFYQPTLRGGGKVHLRMLCLGRHWDARTYKYALRRTDVDGLPVPPIPPSLITLAGRVAADAATTLEADVLIINRYAKGGGLGLHQDKDERPETIARGVPVVSISLGDDADFRFRGAKKTDPLQTIRLRSGDAFVFGASHGWRITASTKS